jgi:hypothetical protein
MDPLSRPPTSVLPAALVGSVNHAPSIPHLLPTAVRVRVCQEHASAHVAQSDAPTSTNNAHLARA